MPTDTTKASHMSNESEPETPPDLGRLRALADSLDCLLEEDLQLLTSTSAATTKGWANRGDGPAYCMLGNRRLYPRQAVSEWMMTRVRERKPVDVRGTL